MVTASDGALHLTGGGQEPLALERIGEAAFIVPALDSIVTFSRDDAGAVTGLTLAQSGEERQAERRDTGENAPG